jgi:hypothetical protein
MVSIGTNYAASSYLNLVSSQANPASIAQSAATSTGSPSAPATSVTLSDAARAALAVKDFPTIIADARTKLDALLKDADRTSPLEGEALALDLSSLDPRELYAMASEDSFSADEQAAAGLEMQRRFEAALSGPAAVSKVTGNLTGLYKAAAAFLDSLGPEEKAAADWMAGRAAVDEGLKQLQADPTTMPDAGEDDPVALYLALVEAGDATEPQPIADVATSVRKALDKLYADAIRNGKAPSFNKQTTVGTYIDMSQFDSRSLSAIALNTGTKFATEEVNAANQALRGKSGAALVAGWQNASKSGDPTAFSQNIISLYSAMGPEERQAAGWSEQFYTAAVENYQSTSKLTQMFAQAGGSSTGFLSWMGK